MVPVRWRMNMARLCAAVLAAISIVAGILLIPASAQAPYDNALPFTRSYLVTGNYAVVGVDLMPQAADCITFSADGCFAKGNITVPVCPTSGAVAPGSCIPEGADVLAAWMYWEAISTDPATVPKAKLRVDGESTYSTLLKARRNDELLPSQGSCLSSSGSLLTLSMFSADVLRFFPLQKDLNNQQTPRRKVTGTHGIALAEVGNGNNARQGAGASLFFVYRLPSDSLKKIVVYDGAYLQQPPGTVTRQQIQGFYQSAAGGTSWLTHIIGTGAKNTTERIYFNDATAPLPLVDPIPFPLGNNEGGNGSDRAWANPTIDVSSKMSPIATSALQQGGFGETVWTSVDHANSSPYECMSWAAVIFSTAVKDAEPGGGDGLPDGLEDAAGGLKDPDPADLLKTVNQTGRDLPNLNAMGASSGAPDVFLEVNGMWAPSGTKYGDETAADIASSKAPFSTILGIKYLETGARHDHLPTPEVIQLMGKALEDAPISIRLHVDVGDVGDYKGLAGFNSAVADKYLICDRGSNGPAGPCVGASVHARGGEIIEEVRCNPNLGTNPTQANSLGCHFPYFPGTVGWKFGLEHYASEPVDGLLGTELTSDEQEECYNDAKYTPDQGNPQPRDCRRRFDPIRAGLFRYFLYAHALGIPKGKQCLDSNGKDADPVNGVCAGTTPNPNFNVPRSTSGAGDAPGSKALITVGLWDPEKHVGSPFLVASTSIHELGHNLDLSHGGRPPDWGNASKASVFDVNCKPNYPSVMSYLFQVNGLLDLAGNARIDFSRSAYGDTALVGDKTLLDESSLHDGYLLLPDKTQGAAFRYRTAWFVPVVAPANGQPGNLAYTLGVQPANRYCTGVKSDTLPSMGRFDGPGLNPDTASTLSLIDFNLNPTTEVQDVNFDGLVGNSYKGHNDWGAIRLNQIGAGKNPAGFSLGQGGFEFGQGGFDFGQGGFEFGQGGFDFGQGGFEFGQGGFDFGQGGFEFGQGGFDFGDGSFNFGQGGFEFGQGGFEFGQGGFDYGQGGFDFGNDIDYDLVKKNGHTPPLAAFACVIQSTGNCTVSETGFLHRNKVTWNAPNVGTVSQYRIYRALGAIPGPNAVEQVCGVTGTPPCPSGARKYFIDEEELPFNQQFTYFVRAVFSNCNGAVEKCESGPSNFAVLEPTVNDAPNAGNDPSGNQNFLTPLNTPLVVAAPGVLLNDRDPDSPPSRIRIVPGSVTGPAHGSVVLNANGSFTYTPVNDYFGPDTFTYSVDNGFWRGNQLYPMSPPATFTVAVTVDKKKK